MKNGEFRPKVLEECTPQEEILAKEPPGTVSQMISYRDQNDDEIARVHQYVRPDGSIAAWGLPDPKRLFEGGVLYRLEKKQKVQ